MEGLDIAKSIKYQGVFKVKSRVNEWQVRRIWSQQLELKHVPKIDNKVNFRIDHSI